MANATSETFRCMMCGHEYQELVEKDEDKERSCPKCRSNSIRRLKKRSGGDVTPPGGTAAPSGGGAG
jgi:putative FmdB family regulatory protein